MFNFGVIEVLNVKSVPAPGWVYVPDTGPQTPLSATQSILSRKRVRNPTLLPGGIFKTAHQSAQVLRELTLLDRENYRDVSIPISIKQNTDQARGRGKPIVVGKSTPTVRKIFQSKKTFENHLADSEAIQASSGSNIPSQTPTNVKRVAQRIGPIAIGAKNSVHQRKKRKNMINNLMTTQNVASSNNSTFSANPADSPLEMWMGCSGQNNMSSLISEKMPPQPSLILSSSTVTEPISHPRDDDPILTSRVPVMPSEEDLESLLARPPLSYLEARGPWVEEDQKKPPRNFCERCGYWAKIKCVKCGGRVCALTCFNKHKDECSKYGS
ncbi:hypothetical protein GcC1_045012 [Golovinomyces cichoracearum]|uniref:HIT-type domain-containing protein n=1 Tax=Golovinomyces cichoracearum TaxID=62708 RepID=A0A420IYL9_9PEZI|nr:hypothetical protein GcC1_045012 [Golovinomyces cichoracearum]